MHDTEALDEYVMNESGYIYNNKGGRWNGPTGREWNFGQVCPIPL